MSERFWTIDPDRDNLSDITGNNWVGIVDEEAGGIIAYCHRDNFDKVVAVFS